MTDGPIQIDPVKANPYMLLEPDELGVLGSTRWVVEQAKHVQINRDHVRDACSAFLKRYSPATEATWYERFHFYDGTERTVNWLLVLDALNFCFWAEKGQPRWRIDYHGEILDGYWAEAAALTRAVEEGIALWDAGYLSTMSREDLAYIFRGVQSADGAAGEMIPLFEQRLEHVHEVGRVLLERYDGQFAHAVKQAEGSAVKLTLLLALFLISTSLLSLRIISCRKYCGTMACWNISTAWQSASISKNFWQPEERRRWSCGLPQSGHASCYGVRCRM